eukprot:1349836-Pleurochrysis_carterae.AAC.7
MKAHLIINGSAPQANVALSRVGVLPEQIADPGAVRTRCSVARRMRAAATRATRMNSAAVTILTRFFRVVDAVAVLRHKSTQDLASPDLHELLSDLASICSRGNVTDAPNETPAQFLRARLGWGSLARSYFVIHDMMDGDGEPPSEHMALLKGGESATRCCDLVVGLLKIALYLILFLLLCLLVLKPVDMFICDIVQLDGWFIDVVMAVFLIMLDIVLLEGMRRLLDWLFTR